MKIGTIEITAVESQPFAENTYILAVEGNQECLVVDPGFEPNKIFDELSRLNLIPAVILNTHGHSDHIAGNTHMKERWPDAPLVIGTGDAPKLTDPTLNLSAAFGGNLVSCPADQTVDEDETISFAGIQMEVLDTPGHSSGHVIFVIKQVEPWIIIGGDVLFAGSVGRTDFPDGSFEQLKDAIHKKMFVLPEETIVLPGHGPSTTIGHEKRSNPFVGAQAGYNV